MSLPQISHPTQTQSSDTLTSLSLHTFSSLYFYSAAASCGLEDLTDPMQLLVSSSSSNRASITDQQYLSGSPSLRFNKWSWKCKWNIVWNNYWHLRGQYQTYQQNNAITVHHVLLASGSNWRMAMSTVLQDAVEEGLIDHSTVNSVKPQTVLAFAQENTHVWGCL